MATWLLGLDNPHSSNPRDALSVRSRFYNDRANREHAGSLLRMLI
jgi:hypothetical protein